MEQLTTILIRLLRERDFVALPGIGTLIAARVPSRLDQVRSLLFPPAKSITFNPDIQRNDGLLVDAIAETFKISLNDGQVLWEKWKTRLLQDIHDNGRLEIKGLGTFTFANKVIGFMADEFGENLLSESYGLRPIVATPVSKVRRMVKPPTTKSVVHSPARWWPKVAAALLFIPLSFYLFWVFSSTELVRSSGNFQISDLNPFAEKICARYHPEAGVYTYASSIENEEKLLLTDSGSVVHINFLRDIDARGFWVRLCADFVPADTTRVDMKVPSGTELKMAAGSFHIVMGCFSVPENAHRYIAELQKKGYSAILLDTFKTLHRVVVSGFVTREAAITALGQIKATEQPDAWLVRK
ncbi:MAG: SPOR domain-containing protein [Flavobacteriales bacterium]|nr:SPOR domain-containing protein [Flavobacteriales bacterium]